MQDLEGEGELRFGIRSLLEVTFSQLSLLAEGERLGTDGGVRFLRD